MALDIKKIGIIGCGQMGRGIAHVCAVAGFGVVLTDTNADVLKGAQGEIKKGMSRLVKRDELSYADMKGALKKISTSKDYKGFKDY